MKIIFGFILLQCSIMINAQINPCEHIFHGYVPHSNPQKCGFFYYCLMTLPTERTCPPNTIFVPHINPNYHEGECQPGKLHDL